MAILSITNNARSNSSPSAIGKRIIYLDHDETYDFSSNDFTTLTVPQYQDPEGDDMDRIKILSLPSIGHLEYLEFLGDPVSVNDEMPKFYLDTGMLKYIPDSSQTTAYTTSFQFDVADTGSNTMSGLSTGIIEIHVSDQVNMPPDSVGNYTHLANWGESIILTRAMFTTLTTPQYSDPEGDPESKLKILSLPENGILKFNGIPVTVGQEIDFLDIDNNHLVFSPDPTITTSNTINIDFAISDTGSNNFTF